jgi:hypothetical protein
LTLDEACALAIGHQSAVVSVHAKIDPPVYTSG